MAKFVKVDDVYVNPDNVLYVGSYRPQAHEIGAGVKFNSEIALVGGTVLAATTFPEDLAKEFSKTSGFGG